jgi:hypothetical protein
MNCAESTRSTNSSICWWPIVESFQWGNLQPFSEFQGTAKIRMTDEQEYAARSQLKEITSCYMCGRGIMGSRFCSQRCREAYDAAFLGPIRTMTAR